MSDISKDGGPAACAHYKVVLKHNDYPDGTRSDYWECLDCGTRFIPDFFNPMIRNLRDWFAGMALQGMMANGFIPNQVTGSDEPQFDYSRSAYRMADAMLAEREKVKP